MGAILPSCRRAFRITPWRGDAPAHSPGASGTLRHARQTKFATTASSPERSWGAITHIHDIKSCRAFKRGRIRLMRRRGRADLLCDGGLKASDPETPATRTATSPSCGANPERLAAVASANAKPSCFPDRTGEVRRRPRWHRPCGQPPLVEPRRVQVTAVIGCLRPRPSGAR